MADIRCGRRQTGHTPRRDRVSGRDCFRTSRYSREGREVGCLHLLDIKEVAICTANTTGRAEDVVTSLVAAKEAIFNFAAARLCASQNRELLGLIRTNFDASAKSGNVPGTPQANPLDRFVVQRAGDVVCGNTRARRRRDAQRKNHKDCGRCAAFSLHLCVSASKQGDFKQPLTITTFAHCPSAAFVIR